MSWWHPEKLSRRSKKISFLLLDWALVPISFFLSFGFRLGFDNPTGPMGFLSPLSSSGISATIVIFALSAALVFLARLYRIRLHSLDIDSLLRIAATGLLLTVLASAIAFFMGSFLPRSVAIYYGITFFSLASTSRLCILAALNLVLGQSRTQTPVAIYGAGLAGIQLASSLKKSPEVKPVMFVDDNPALQGLIVSGLTVQSPSVLEKYAKSGKVKEILVGIHSLSAQKKKELAERMEIFGCQIKVIPSYVDLISGRATFNDLRKVEPDELLGREKVDIDVPEIAKAYAGRSIMVTGAGGSIGSELCLQLTNCAPSKIVLFERSEFGLYNVEKQLKEICSQQGIELVSRLCSVIDKAAVADVIEREQVEVILHAAAYKHVPLIEHNEVEGARNNVLGTRILAEAAATDQVERFILVSTDKAVRPTNIMGATKRLAELVVQDVQMRSPSTRFTMVRFGNVLGSSGSVVPLFREQIEAGGPVTVTDANVTRYFMTESEAARLVLLSGAFSKGEDLFVLDMGKPVKIIDLARRIIELSGRTYRDEHNPDGDIEIAITGLRPGEKMYEELLIDDDTLTDTPHEKILRAEIKGLSEIEVAAMVRKIRDAVEKRDANIIRDIVAYYVDGYSLNDGRNQNPG